MLRRLARFFLSGFLKRPFVCIGLFISALFLVRHWSFFVFFTDNHPMLRILLSAEWAISRYREDTPLFGLSRQSFFWFMLVQTWVAWLFWVVVFFWVSPWVAKKKRVRSIFIYFTLENQSKNFFARKLTGLVLWAQDRKPWDRLIAGIFYFVFSFFSHGDIPAIGVAVGFRQWWALWVILGAMVCKIIMWGHHYLHVP